MEAMLVYVNFGLSQTSVASDHFFFLQDLTERPYCKTKSANEAIITWCQKKLQIEVWRSTHLNNITPGLVSSVKTKSVLLSLED